MVGLAADGMRVFGSTTLLMHTYGHTCVGRVDLAGGGDLGYCSLAGYLMLYAPQRVQPLCNTPNMP